MNSLPLGLEDGRPHTAEFASDPLTNAEREKLAPLVRDSQWHMGDIAQQPKERLNQRSASATSQGAQTTSSPGNVEGAVPPISPQHKTREVRC
jgi:hypothetical protein